MQPILACSASAIANSCFFLLLVETTLKDMAQETEKENALSARSAANVYAIFSTSALMRSVLCKRNFGACGKEPQAAAMATHKLDSLTLRLLKS